MPQTLAKYIVSTPGTCGGRPRVAGTRIRVQDILAWTEQGKSPDEIVSSFPQLSLSKVHAALAYYHDHTREINRDFARDVRLVKSLSERRKKRAS